MIAVEPRRTLADTLRDQCGLTGTNSGCEHGVCGSCTVLVDNEPVRSCLMFAVQAAGHKVRTVEGLADGERLHPLQQAFIDEQAAQCGYCIPGMIMSAKALLDANPKPSDADIVEALAGNLWIPHNGRKVVESRDRDGNELTKFGKAGRDNPECFGGCCEPKNLRSLANGEILVAESGPPTCIKRLSATGKLLEVVAVVETKGDCVRVVVDRSPDGSRYYLMDTTRDAIRVFKAKS